MKNHLLVLGSAAAEGIPALFCDCPVCKKAAQNGGKDLRMRTAYRLSPTVGIDFGPDSMAQEFRFGLHSEKLRHILMTHSHSDHLQPNEFFWRRKGFSVLAPDSLLHIHGNQAVIDRIRTQMIVDRSMEFDEDMFALRLHLCDAFRRDVLAGEGIAFTPLPANHAPSEKPYIFLIEQNGRNLLLANDTGYFPDETWAYLEENKVRLSAVIADCTIGLNCAMNGHMGCDAAVLTHDRLMKNGLIDASTPYYINHFSHNGRAIHADLEAFFQPHGIQVGFDGLDLEW